MSNSGRFRGGLRRPTRLEPDGLGGGAFTPFSDNFNRANGALGSPWSGATWAIVSNAAVNTPSLGADVIVNGGFDADTDWTKGSGWAIAAGVATKAVTAQSSLDEAVGTVGVWYQSQFTLTRRAGTFNAQFAAFGAATGVQRSSSGTFTETKRATGTALGVRASSNDADGDVDNVSFLPLTLSELFASLQVTTANVLANINVTGPTATAGIQAGLVLNLDSAATPANFVIAYLDGKGNCLLDKCVAGVYTTVISAAVTYSAGATLRVIKSGTSYSLFYNNAAVGSVGTISDAGIVNNILHGLFSTSPLNSLDNFSLS